MAFTVFGNLFFFFWVFILLHGPVLGESGFCLALGRVYTSVADQLLVYILFGESLVCQTFLGTGEFVELYL